VLALPGSVAHGKSETHMQAQRIPRHDAVARHRFMGNGTHLMRIELGSWLGVVRTVRVFRAPYTRLYITFPARDAVRAGDPIR
jgi:hypothetical protein